MRCHVDEHCCPPIGMSWQDKITALRAKMTERKTTWFVATALDEIACTVHFSEMHITVIASATVVTEHSNGGVEMLYLNQQCIELQ